MPELMEHTVLFLNTSEQITQMVHVVLSRPVGSFSNIALQTGLPDLLLKRLIFRI